MVNPVRERKSIPMGIRLEQNYPNPFNPTTTIRFTLSSNVHHYVSLIVYNILGRKVTTLVQEQKQPGTYELSWDSRGVASGVYFCRLASNGFVDTKKIMLLR